MLSNIFVRQSVKEDNRVAMPKINQEALNKILIAVPPLAEQNRIVVKVDELMALCDELESRIITTTTTRRYLMEATLHDVLNSHKENQEMKTNSKRLGDNRQDRKRDLS
jgi:type I restriction enzyme S subunit